VIVSSTERQTCLNLTYQDPDLFLKTLNSDGNTWFGLTAPQIASLAGVKMTLAEWQTATGQDTNSHFGDPGLVDPQDLNFWRSDAGTQSPTSWPASKQ
jgi:hypothetical protein